MSDKLKNNLPPNWSWVKLGDVAEYINGRAFKPIEWEKQGLPIIRIQNLNDEAADFNYSTKLFEKKYLVENGDLLFAWSASLGTYFWNRGKAWLNQHIFKVLPKDKISKRFLFYTLNFIVDQFYAKTHGSGMVHITKNKFEETAIPLPPLPEQKKIVEKIEELFSGLDNGVASLKKAKEQIRLYRQSVLASAFSGKLTQSAQRQSHSELPEGWKWVKLGDVCEKIVGGGTPSTKVEKYWNGNISWITSADIYGIKDIRPRKKITKEAIENSATNLVTKDTIIVVTRVSLGRLAITNQDICFSQDCQGLILKKGIVSHNYVLWFLSSATQIFKYKNRGTTIKGVTKKQLADLEFVLPPLKQQNQIVEEIEKRFSEADNLEKAIDDSLAKSETLRQSILKQAFEGKLV